MKGMILAAGYGTRLRPLTWTLPKPLVPLCNRPLIGWAIESFLAAGVRDLIINLHHLPDAIEHYVVDRYSADATILFSREAEILGTGGGVRRVRSLLEDESDFFLVNGDTVQFAPFGAMADARRATDALVALTLRHPPARDRFTPVFLDNGIVTGFGSGGGEALMFSGAHLISSRIFQYLPDKEFSGIVDEVYQPAIDSGSENIAGVVDDGLWFDVGTPQRYLGAMNGLLEATVRRDVKRARHSSVVGDSIVDDSASVLGRVKASTIGARSVIHGEVRGSAVWDDCVISSEVTLDGCIVGHGVEIKGPLTLQNAVICCEDAAIPRDAGYEIRDGLVTLRF